MCHNLRIWSLIFISILLTIYVKVIHMDYSNSDGGGSIQLWILYQLDGGKTKVFVGNYR